MQAFFGNELTAIERITSAYYQNGQRKNPTAAEICAIKTTLSEMRIGSVSRVAFAILNSGVTYFFFYKNEKMFGSVSLLWTAQSLVKAWDFYQTANQLEATYASGTEPFEIDTEAEFKKRIARMILDESLSHRLQNTLNSFIEFMKPGV